MDEEQQRIDEEARRAAEAQMRALDGLGGRTADAVAPVIDRPAAAPPTRHVDLDITPEESRQITDSAFHDMPLDDPGAPNTDALSEAGAYRDPNDDPPAAVSEATDYGAAGMQQMQHAIDGGGSADLAAPSAPQLARDDMEPLGGVSRSGQMFAPSGAPESAEDRFSRLGTGGDFSASAIAPTSAAAALGLADEPEAVDNPTEEGQEAASAKADSSPELRALDTEEQRGEAPGLDAGLPSEEEIGSAHTADDIRRPFHALGAMFLGAGGRAVPTFEDSAAPLEQERRAGLRQALAAKGATRAQEATQAATSARQQIQDALAERRVAAAEAMVPTRQAQAEAQAEATRARTGLTEAQTSHLTTGDEMRGTPEERDQSARDAWRVGVDRLPAGPMRDRLAAQYSPERLASATAAQLAGPLAMLQRLSVGVRAGSGGGAARPAAAPGEPGTPDDMAALFVEHGVSPDIASARREVAALGDHAWATLQARMGEESVAPPGPQQQGAIAAANTSLGEVNAILGRYRGGDIPGVGLIDSRTPTLALSREGQEMRGALLDLSNNYLRMVSGAAVPEHEVQDFADRLATYDEGQFRSAVARLGREIQARSQGATTSSDRRRAAPGVTPASRGAASSTTTGDMVRMRLPSGEIRRFPAARAADAEALGATRL